MASEITTSSGRKPFWQGLFFQVVVATCIGIGLGIFYPHFAESLKPLGDGFIRLIKMIFAPVIALTVILGVARMENMRDLGRVGVVSLVYFEVVSTFALVLGLVTVHLLQPGAGMNIDPATLDTKALASFTAAKSLTFEDFVLNIIPTSVIDSFAKNDVLQIIFFSVLLGVALSALGKRAKPLVETLESLTESVFYIVRLIMRLAPIGTLGAIAFTVGKYGSGSILSMGKVMGAMYLTAFLFIAIVLNVIARFSEFSLWKLIKYIKDELVTVFATGSSESGLPQIMEKLVKLGVPRTVVGITIPAGLTFNPDGQCIYYTLAAIFIAQATNTPLTITDQLIVLGVLMVASKGSAGVTGSGFITLAAVLASLGKIPVAGMVLLLGVDPFMSRARGFTNTLGNTVAAMAIARWVGAADMAVVNANLEIGPENKPIPSAAE
ncbi:MAG TPA: C4-dicarboxylate transporter DctA [Telmatospirillum sp.]|nr:C4-dicarboxylate transporter DctA [Telmatospirillum sp.]